MDELLHVKYANIWILCANIWILCAYILRRVCVCMKFYVHLCAVPVTNEPFVHVTSVNIYSDTCMPFAQNMHVYEALHTPVCSFVVDELLCKMLCMRT